jgi:integrase
MAGHETYAHGYAVTGTNHCQNMSRQPLRIDPHTLARRREATVVEYRKAVASFMRWCDKHYVSIYTVHVLDDFLVEWKQSGISKSSFAYALAGCEIADSRIKGQLVWSRQVLKDWEHCVVPNSHIPMVETAAIMMAFALSHHNNARMGAMLLVQKACGLRPSEAISLKPEACTILQQTRDCQYQRALLSLGVRAGTKSNRAQTALLRGDRYPLAFLMLQQLLHSTPADCYLCNCTLAQYQAAIVKTARSLELPQFTSHSPRAGFASDSILTFNDDFVTVREAGRWLHDKTLRIYLDFVGVASQRQHLALSGMQHKADLLLQEAPLCFRWWSGCQFSQVKSLESLFGKA